MNLSMRVMRKQNEKWLGDHLRQHRVAQAIASQELGEDQTDGGPRSSGRGIDAAWIEAVRSTGDASEPMIGVQLCSTMTSVETTGACVQKKQSTSRWDVL
jgi:hypothetical protein